MQATLGTSRLPDERRDAMRELALEFQRLAGSNLLGLSAFGGWLCGDPFFAQRPASCVAVLARVDLGLLDRLAEAGPRYGRLRLRAPLIMTPGYIADSLDVFPLEFLEIQQLHRTLLGADHFAGLQFERDHVRLQAERELKTQLIGLRQGLLAAGGRRSLLAPVCLEETIRSIRVLRGALLLAGEPPAEHAADVAARAERCCEVALPTLRRIIAGVGEITLDDFSRLYSEIDRLAQHVNGRGAASNPDPGAGLSAAETGRYNKSLRL